MGQKLLNYAETWVWKLKNYKMKKGLRKKNFIGEM
jgi:hypothetical protein